MKLGVIVAESNPDFLGTFVSLLGTDFEVVATALDGESALQQIRDWRPDVAVLDIELSRLGAIALTQKVTCDLPTPAVVICSLETDREFAQAGLRAGARGYVLKTRPATDLIAAVNSVATGQHCVPYDSWS
jgi:DNA-binding NarL/FixJ family response regulator